MIKKLPRVFQLFFLLLLVLAVIGFASSKLIITPSTESQLIITGMVVSDVQGNGLKSGIGENYQLIIEGERYVYAPPSIIGNGKEIPFQFILNDRPFTFDVVNTGKEPSSGRINIYEAKELTVQDSTLTVDNFVITSSETISVPGNKSMPWSISPKIFAQVNNYRVSFVWVELKQSGKEEQERAAIISNAPLLEALFKTSTETQPATSTDYTTYPYSNKLTEKEMQMVQLIRSAGASNPFVFLYDFFVGLVSGELFSPDFKVIEGEVSEIGLPSGPLEPSGTVSEKKSIVSVNSKLQI